MFLFAQLLMPNNFSETNLSSANKKKKMSKLQFVIILQFFIGYKYGSKSCTLVSNQKFSAAAVLSSLTTSFGF